MPERLPKRLFYRWAEGGEEIEYPTDIPDPAPEIKCDEIFIDQPPPLPSVFTVYALQPAWGFQGYQYPAYVNQSLSYQVPEIRYAPYFSSGHFQIWIRIFTQFGTSYEIGSSTSAIYAFGTAFMTPSGIQAPRRDLLVGDDRIINPNVNTPCPKWRFTGGNCPPGSKDCGDCCLDCASTKASIDAITASISPFTTWRPK